MMSGWYDDGWGLGAWIAMVLMMLAFWGLVAVLGVYVIRNFGRRPADHISAPSEPADQSLRILDERFARGEIDADEYNHRRDVLSSP